MVCTRRQKLHDEEAAEKEITIISGSLQTLLDFIGDPFVGLKAPALRRLYDLLVQLSFNVSCGGVALRNVLEGLGSLGLTLKIDDVVDLSCVMFRKLSSRFNDLDSALECSTFDELVLLLRCCMVSLTLLEVEQDELYEKFLILIEILSRFNCLFWKRENGSIKFRNPVFKDFYRSLGFIDHFDAHRPFLLAVLEVFADELLVHRLLRENLMRFSCRGDLRSIVEVISAHFIVTYSDELAFNDFPSRLYWHCPKDQSVPELSLNPCVSFLLDSTFLSAPKLLQTHVVLLVSEGINISVSASSSSSDLRMMDSYLSSLERTVVLYGKHLSDFQLNSQPIVVENAASCIHQKSSGQSFQASIQAILGDKIDYLVTKFQNRWNSFSSKSDAQTEADILSASIVYMKENQNILDESLRDDILELMHDIIMRSSEGITGSSIHDCWERKVQDLFFLAAIMKGMSVSLLQTIRCLSHSGNKGSLKSLKDFPRCTEYHFIVGLISCFQHLDAFLASQGFLFDKIETHNKLEGSKQMLQHFAVLLSLSFHCKFDFLAKGCIYTMMTVMNLVVFEDGNLDVLRSLLDSRLKSYGSKVSRTASFKFPKDKRSIQNIAYNFQQIQKRYTSRDLERDVNEGHQLIGAQSATGSQKVLAVEGEAEKISRSKKFLDCVLEGRKKPSDYDDLASFIECKQGKDYDFWLKYREKYRSVQFEKRAALWEKRKRVAKSSMEKKIKKCRHITKRQDTSYSSWPFAHGCRITSHLYSL